MQVCLANHVPFIAFRSLSDLAGGTSAANQAEIFLDLAATNAVIVLTSFIKLI
jgi:adenosylhomocysteine nucleosidase